MLCNNNILEIQLNVIKLINYFKHHITSISEKTGRKSNGLHIGLNEAFVEGACSRWEDDITFMIRWNSPNCHSLQTYIHTKNNFNQCNDNDDSNNK